MSEESVRKRNRRPVWWVLMILSVVVVAGTGLTVYKTWRQHRLITLLKSRGAQFETKPLFDHTWPEWMRRYLDNVLLSEIDVRVMDTVAGSFDREDIVLATELMLLGRPGSWQIGTSRLSLATRYMDRRTLELLGRSRNLKLLYLDAASVTDSELAYLRDSIHLQSLSLDDNQITDAGLEKISNLTNLEWLFLNGTQITDAGLVHVRKLKHLKYLSLNRTAVSDVGLRELAHCPNLELINLDGTKTTSSGLKRLRSALPGTIITVPPALRITELAN